MGEEIAPAPDDLVVGASESHAERISKMFAARPKSVVASGKGWGRANAPANNDNADDDDIPMGLMMMVLRTWMTRHSQCPDGLDDVVMNCLTASITDPLPTIVQFVGLPRPNASADLVIKARGKFPCLATL